MGLTKTLSKQIPLLTIFTILTYAMAYCYQKGVAAYYGYPDLFIKIVIYESPLFNIRINILSEKCLK